MFFCVIKIVESFNSNLPYSRFLYNFIESLIEEIGNIFRDGIFDVLKESSVLYVLFVFGGVEFSYGSDLLCGEEDADLVTEQVKEMWG